MDLRSDILPPPEFIVETHLTVLQIAKALHSDAARYFQILFDQFLPAVQQKDALQIRGL
jgi:hypothetical protein